MSPLDRSFHCLILSYLRTFSQAGRQQCYPFKIKGQANRGVAKLHVVTVPDTWCRVISDWRSVFDDGRELKVVFILMLAIEQLWRLTATKILFYGTIFLTLIIQWELMSFLSALFDLQNAPKYYLAWPFQIPSTSTITFANIATASAGPETPECCSWQRGRDITLMSGSDNY